MGDYEDCRFGKVYLRSHEDLVRYSFLVQKSLTPLDLSTLEFSCRSPTTFTEEGFQKLNAVKKRRVLFTYNLDVSHGLEKALKENDPTSQFGTTINFETSVYRGVKLPKNYYYQCVYPDITNAIENSRDKVVTLRKFLPLMKMMQVSLKSLKFNQFKYFAHILQEECTDSELVAEFVEVLGKEHFYRWLTWNHGVTEHMEYFLYHMQKMNIDMQLEEGDCCPVSISLFMGRFQRAIALMKYGKMRQHLNAEDVKHDISWFSVFNKTAMNWIKRNRRYFQGPELCADDLSCIKKLLFLLLVSVFRYNMIYEKLRREFFFRKGEVPNLGIQALRLMWRSLPEAYLTFSYVQSVWRPDSDLDQLQPTADEVYTWYKTEIIDSEYQVSDVVRPRLLQHLTRCEIRRRLSNNCALPDGIQHLGLPHQFQLFLSLEC